MALKYKNNPKLKTFSKEELELEIWNRDMIEEEKLKEVRKKEVELKLHMPNFESNVEYLSIEYDASNHKKYFKNLSTATRVYAIVETNGLRAHLLSGKENRIIVHGVSDKIKKLAEWAKLIYLGLDLLANPKLNAYKEIKKVFPDYKFDNEPL